MPREIWLGPILNGNRAVLVERCRALLREGRGREFVYLAATRPLMDLVTADMLGGELAGTSDPLNVFLLSGFSRRVFANAVFDDTGEPLPFYAPIDTDLRPVQRPLFGRIVARLAEADRLRSFGQLARTDGLVTSMAALVAEIQRAGRTASQFRDAIRRREALDAESRPERERPATETEGGDGDAVEAKRIASIDYDEDTALVYELYERVLDEHHLTDASRDYLRALMVLSGEFLDRPVRVPFLDEAKLLVVDGFFDILPVHAELLGILLRRFPETIVNLNDDQRNPEAFRAFRDVVDRFGERSGFSERYSVECGPVAPALHSLREMLFNLDAPDRSEGGAQTERAVVALTAPDRLREVRGVAREIKRLVFEEGLAASEIAVVSRSRDRYESFVREVFADEGIACSLGEKRTLTELPAARAAMKLLDAAVSNSAHDARRIRVGRLVSMLKSDYFQVSADAVRAVQPHLPFDEEAADSGDLTVSPDEIENAVAYVGAELNLEDWLRRAHALIGRLAHSGPLASASDDNCADEDRESTEVRRPQRARLDFPIDVLRRAVGTLDAVGHVVASIPYEAPAEEMARAFRTALDSLSFGACLEEAARRAALDEGALRRAALDLRAREGLERALDAVVEAARMASTIETPKRPVGETRSTRAELRADLHRAMDAHAIPIAAEQEGGIRVLSATDMRGLRFAAVFVLGLVEGEFPERARGDWIYPQHERETFREVGLPLEDISPEESLRNEEHYFYQTACRATSRLVLCRPLSGDDDSETIASQFLAEVERVLGADAVERRVVTSGFDGETLLEATTPAELARAVVRAEREVASGPAPIAVPVAVVAALGAFARESRPGRAPILGASALRRIAVERRRESGPFDAYDGVVGDPELCAILRETYGDHVFSASELNEFGNCGFRFFLHRVLGVRPRVEAALDLQSLDRGILLHDVLRRFFEGYRGVWLPEVSRDELRAALGASCAAVFERYESSMPPLSPKLWRIERQTLEILLDRMLEDELELQSQLPRMTVRHLELAFGMPSIDGDAGSASRPLAIARRTGDGGDETMFLRGQIDRVDEAPDGRLVAYDYKTSRGPAVSDMVAGRDVQLGIYIEAIEQLFLGERESVAGGGYYSLKPMTGRRNNGLYRSDMRDVTAISTRCGSSLHPDVWQDLRRTIARNLWSSFDKIRGGDFRVAPSRDEETCAYCDYSMVCRFDRHRVRIKGRAETARLTGLVPTV